MSVRSQTELTVRLTLPKGLPAPPVERMVSSRPGGKFVLARLAMSEVRTASPSTPFSCMTLPRKYGSPDSSGVSGLAASRPLGSIDIGASTLLKKLLFVMIACVPSCARGSNRLSVPPRTLPLGFVTPVFSGVENGVSRVMKARTDW